jgi:hypothetical protein
MSHRRAAAASEVTLRAFAAGIVRPALQLSGTPAGHSRDFLCQAAAHGVGELFDVLATWRAVASDVQGRALDFAYVVASVV